MKSVKMVISALVLATATSAAAEDLVIRWGTEAGYRPFIYKTSEGELTGLDVEIGNAICEELQAKCEWVEQDWDGIIPGLLGKRYDGILSSMTITEERRRVIEFSDPYYATPAGFVGKLDMGLNDDETLAGKTIGVLRGSTHASFIINERPDVTVREYPTQDEVWLDLTAGRIDASFVNQIAAQEGFLGTENGEGFGLFGKSYIDPAVTGSGIGVGFRKADVELREKVNGAIKAIYENGTFRALNEKYVPFYIGME
ncbi:transporter substrate-binding domain-containing protein [Cognatishimia sp. 1_MG-2023]|uniref:transporter substrate-binding domain-containing protein n=1 Tax=Cognatishimia sp. 1_MG-2023 TaxID=3062642 RepID=UPI0026E359F6|nr:transporter substrate-binding domain-containing protein [Cognatishimia sp. 1_MG-2023]MDO6728249.1 transporter substrate-binding domain-containing protein [Cognatishimia sp. 1_MG-2023]